MPTLSDLEKLNELKEKGIISSQEFEQQKTQILLHLESDSEFVSTQKQAQTVIYNTNGVAGNGAFNSLPPPKSRLMYIVLALFFGSLGFHNFYAGYNGRGLTQLLITLFLGWLIIPLIFVEIWVLFEILVVNNDVYNRPM